MYIEIAMLCANSKTKNYTSAPSTFKNRTFWTCHNVNKYGLPYRNEWENNAKTGDCTTAADIKGIPLENFSWHMIYFVSPLSCHSKHCSFVSNLWVNNWMLKEHLYTYTHFLKQKVNFSHLNILYLKYYSNSHYKKVKVVTAHNTILWIYIGCNVVKLHKRQTSEWNGEFNMRSRNISQFSIQFSNTIVGCFHIFLQGILNNSNSRCLFVKKGE